ncbi:hypothetical protein AB0C13_28360, partial [Streptomyces sp. NPDC049099]
ALDRFHERVRGTSARIAALERHKALTTSLASAVVLLLQGAATVGVTWPALRAHAAGALPAVHLTVLAVLALVSFETPAPLPAAARHLAEVGASARRLADLLDTPHPVTDPSAPARSRPVSRSAWRSPTCAYGTAPAGPRPCRG